MNSDVLIKQKNYSFLTNLKFLFMWFYLYVCMYYDDTLIYETTTVLDISVF